MSEHICNFNQPWPTGHPLPPEDPDKLRGPEVGEYMVYHHVRRWGTGDGNGGTVWHEEAEDRIVRVIRRSYVWSPGECRSKGGYRRYDWSVIEEGPGEYRSVVVDDKDLSPLPVDQWSGKPKKVNLVYAVRP